MFSGKMSSTYAYLLHLCYVFFSLGYLCGGKKKREKGKIMYGNMESVGEKRTPEMFSLWSYEKQEKGKKNF